jgi:hypothetical protein
MPLSPAQRAEWSVRFGTIGGAALGLLATFGVAWLAESAGKDPEWILRVGSATGMLGLGWLGRRLGASRGEAMYAPLGAATGLLLAATTAVLLSSVFGAAR